MNNEKLDLNYVFVYGTLKQGFYNHIYLEKSVFLGKAIVKGTLISLGNFPALIPQKMEGDSRVVWGEVYLIDNETLDKLDRLEKMYHRKRTIAQAEGNRRIAVWSYYWGGQSMDKL